MRSGGGDASFEGTDDAEELDMEDVVVAECGQHLSRGIEILRSIVEQKLAAYPALQDVGISEQSEQAAIMALQGTALPILPLVASRLPPNCMSQVKAFAS
jgi:hypothetical protein